MKKICFTKFKRLNPASHVFDSNNKWGFVQTNEYPALRECFVNHTDVEIVQFSDLDENTTLIITFDDWRPEQIFRCLKEQIQFVKAKNIVYDFSAYDLQEIPEDVLDQYENLVDTQHFFITGNLISKRENHFWFPDILMHYVDGREPNYATFEALHKIEKIQKPFVRKYKGLYNAGHTRYHKVEVLEFLHQKGLLKEFMWACTSPDFDPVTFDDFVPNYFKDSFNKFDIINYLPYSHDYEKDFNYQTGGCNFNLVPYLDSYFEIVAETRFYHILPGMGAHHLTFPTWAHISEKILRPTFTGHPFVLIGKPGVIESMEKLGLKYRFDFWNHSYDQIEDAYERMEAIKCFIDRITSMSKKQLLDFKQEYNIFTKDNCRILYFDVYKNIVQKMYSVL